MLKNSSEKVFQSIFFVTPQEKSQCADKEWGRCAKYVNQVAFLRQIDLKTLDIFGEQCEM